MESVYLSELMIRNISKENLLSKDSTNDVARSFSFLKNAYEKKPEDVFMLILTYFDSYTIKGTL